MIPVRSLAAFALALLALPARASLADVQAHLNATRTFSADFTQIAADGQVQRGHVTLARPGHVRFQYDDQHKLIVADGHSVKLIDYRVSQVSSYPIKGPLAVLLDDDRDISKYARVAEEDARGIVVEAAIRKHPEFGVTTIDFARDSAGPAGLRIAGWQVKDAQGNVTRLTLGAVEFNKPVDPALFRFRDPRRKNGSTKG